MPDITRGVHVADYTGVGLVRPGASSLWDTIQNPAAAPAASLGYSTHGTHDGKPVAAQPLGIVFGNMEPQDRHWEVCDFAPGSKPSS